MRKMYLSITTQQVILIRNFLVIALFEIQLSFVIEAN